MTGILPLIWMIGCAPDALDFKEHTFTAEQEVLEPAFEDLLWPNHLLSSESGLYWVERDAGQLHLSDSEGILESWDLNIESPPLALLSNDDDVIWQTDVGIYSQNGDTIVGESTGILFNHTQDGENSLYWTIQTNDSTQLINDRGTEWTLDFDVHEAISVNDTLYLLDRGSKTLYWFDTETNAVTVAFNFTDEPRKLYVESDTLYATTRSSRWPYGGWIVELNGSEDSCTETRISDSPPEAEYLLVFDEHLYWSSKQSITRVALEGGTYEMVASMTTVGSMIIHNNSLWWSDSKGGRLFALSL
jgi:hypothetical protein